MLFFLVVSGVFTETSTARTGEFSSSITDVNWIPSFLYCPSAPAKVLEYFGNVDSEGWQCEQ